MKNTTKYRITGPCTIIAKDTEERRHKIVVRLDEFPLNPRQDWDNVDHMIVDWNGYDLGDRKDGSVSDELIRLVRDHCSEAEVIDAALGEESKLKTIRLIKDTDPEAEEDDYILQMWCEWRSAFNRGLAHWEDDYFIKKEYAFDYIIDMLTVSHCVELLRPHMEILPLSIYEHTGITMNIGAPTDDFDAGYAGFIYVTKKEAFDNWFVTEEGWREIADKHMALSVETYADFLEGDVYECVVYDSVDYPAEVHHEVATNAETGEITSDRVWKTDAHTEWEEDEEGWCGGYFGYDHEKNGLLGELPDTWEIISVD